MWPTGLVGIPRWLSGKNPPASAGAAGDVGLIPRLARSPGGGNGNPLQHSCPGKPMDREAWRATVHVVAKSWTRLSDQAHTHGLSRSMAFGILPDQGSNPCILHWQVDSLPLSHQGSPETRRFLVEEEGSQGLQSSKQSRSCGQRGGVGLGFKKNGNSWKMCPRNVIGGQPGSRRLSEWH